MKKSNKEIKAWMERQYGTSHGKVTITCNGKTYTGHMYGNDASFDGDEFYQYLLTDTALLKLYYHIPEGCTDLNIIDYTAPYDVRAEDMQYWLDYII